MHARFKCVVWLKSWISSKGELLNTSWIRETFEVKVRICISGRHKISIYHTFFFHCWSCGSVEETLYLLAANGSVRWSVCRWLFLSVMCCLTYFHHFPGVAKPTRKLIMWNKRNLSNRHEARLICTLIRLDCNNEWAKQKPH